MCRGNQKELSRVRPKTRRNHSEANGIETRTISEYARGESQTGGVVGDEKELGPNEQTVFRGIVARANHLSQDRGDTWFAVKELSR